MTTAEHWDTLHQTERLAILTRVYLPDSAVDVVECSLAPFDELPDQVQNDLSYLTWRE